MRGHERERHKREGLSKVHAVNAISRCWHHGGRGDSGDGLLHPATRIAIIVVRVIVVAIVVVVV